MKAGKSYEVALEDGTEFLGVLDCRIGIHVWFKEVVITKGNLKPNREFYSIILLTEIVYLKELK